MTLLLQVASYSASQNLPCRLLRKDHKKQLVPSVQDVSPPELASCQSRIPSSFSLRNLGPQQTKLSSCTWWQSASKQIPLNRILGKWANYHSHSSKRH
ncbi:hypothetical protein Mapa_002614 [Marchantia paleacea]|nr:hypothetical protein Mapa_002614 [Marchantia paleacea]